MDGRRDIRRHSMLEIALAGRVVQPLMNLTRPARGTQITAGAADRMKWRCLICGGEWDARVCHVAGRGTGCPYCARPNSRPLPDILRQLDVKMVGNLRRPDRLVSEMTSRSSDLCDWECNRCDRRWRTRVARMVDAGGCAKCVRGRRKPRDPVASIRPDLIDEFLTNLTTGRDLHHVTKGCSDRSRWRCRRCGHIWTATIASRVLSGSGCRPCANHRVSVAAMIPLRTASPSLAVEFVRNDSAPGRTADTTPSCSRDRVVWKCLLGHQWQTTVAQRTKLRTGCPDCTARQRRSRFELEVGHLITAATGLLVGYDHRVPVAAAGRREVRVDLIIPEHNLLIELDPTHWHSSAAGVRRDTAKSHLLAGFRLVRVRPRHLPAVPAPTLQVDDDGIDPRPWAEAICAYLDASIGVSVSTLDDSAVRRAVGAAAVAWVSVVGDPPSPSLATAYPDMAAEFVANLDRPGLTAAVMAPASNDRCAWRCQACGHTWAVAANSRTFGVTGCPSCARHTGGRSKARANAETCLAVLRPAVAQLFIRNLTNPPAGPDQLHTKSRDRCLWRCPTCPSTRELRVADAVKGNSCAACGYKRIGEARISAAARKGRVLTISHPELAAQVDVAQSGRTPDRIPTAGRDPVWWRCPVDSSHSWRASPYRRTSPRQPAGCPHCARTRRRAPDVADGTKVTI